MPFHFLFYTNRACYPGGHHWNHHPGALSLSQVTTTHLRMGFHSFLLLVKSMGAWFSTELQRLSYMIGYQDDSASSGHREHAPFIIMIFITQSVHLSNETHLLMYREKINST